MKKSGRAFFLGSQKKNASSFSLAPASMLAVSPTSHQQSFQAEQLLFNDSWKEVKVELVKKKKKIFFFSERIIILYENGYLGYVTSKDSHQKDLISPADIKSVTLEGKTQMKLSTKKKSYQFKFNSEQAARDWLVLLFQAKEKARMESQQQAKSIK